jgi:hypothetical protein
VRNKNIFYHNIIPLQPMDAVRRKVSIFINNLHPFPKNHKPVVDPTKLFFLANEEFLRFLLVSLHFVTFRKKFIDNKMT